MQVMEIKKKALSIEEYIDQVRPYLNNLIDTHRTQGEWLLSFFF